MANDSTWTIYAPIIIVFLAALLNFLAMRRSIVPDGWYNCIDKASYTFPNWFFILIWAIIYILLIIVWSSSNSQITNSSTYTIINWIFTINIVLTMAWFFLFFGDGNLVAGLIILILLLVSAGVLIFLLGSTTWSLIILVIYFIWIFYLILLNYYAVTHNFIIRDQSPTAFLGFNF